MKLKRHQTLIPFKIAVIEWYDGVFSGLVRFEQSQSWFLMSLICELSGYAKIYVLKLLNGHDLSKLKDRIGYENNYELFWRSTKSLDESDFSELKNDLSSILRANEGEVFLAATEDISRGITIHATMPDFHRDIPLDIEVVTSLSEDQKNYWRGLLDG